MAKPKAGQPGKKRGNFSKGQIPTVNRKLKNAMRRDYLESGERIANQLAAHRRGKRTMVTIPNPNPNETNKRFIRVPGKDFFKDEELPTKSNSRSG